MTQEKLRRVVTAAAVAGTLVVVCLLAVIGYQIIKVIVLNNRIKEVEKDIAAYEEEIEKNIIAIESLDGTIIHAIIEIY